VKRRPLRVNTSINSRLSALPRSLRHSRYIPAISHHRYGTIECFLTLYLANPLVSFGRNKRTGGFPFPRSILPIMATIVEIVRAISLVINDALMIEQERRVFASQRSPRIYSTREILGIWILSQHWQESIIVTLRKSQ